MKKRSLLITLLSLILTFSVSIGLTTTKAYAKETPVEYSMGDANLDGNVNTRDVVLIKQSIVGLVELTERQKTFADVYADGNINTRDVVLIQQYIVGMDVELEPHEHVFDKMVEDELYLKSEATCLTAKSYYYSCECGVQGEEAFTVGEPLGHSYTEVVSAPTCEDKGYTTYTCRCGDSYVDNYVDELGHDYKKVVLNHDNTTHTLVCTNDSKHKIVENCYGGNATCENKGICDGCKMYYGTPLGHDYGDWVRCNNYTHQKICANDNSHRIVENCSGGVATCEDKAICDDCDSEYGLPLGHNYGAWERYSNYTHIKTCQNDESHQILEACKGGTATCTEKAICSICKTGYGVPKGHSYGEWISNDDGTHTRICANDTTHRETKNCKGGTATCTKKAICQYCNAEYGELKPHDYKVVVTNPTCEEQGYTTYTCTCGHSYVDNYINTSWHNFINDSCTVCGEEEYTKGLVFTLINNDTEYSVTGYTGSESDILIPLTHKNKPVVSLGNGAFYNNKIIKKVDFAKNSNIITINKDAFYNCYNLETIVIPNSVISIGDNVFFSCIRIVNVSFEENSKLETIGEYAFYYNTNLSNIVIPNSVISIGQRAFEKCTAITSMTLPFVGASISGPSHLGYLFNVSLGNTGPTRIPTTLKTVIITGVKHVPADAFRGANSIERIELPLNITGIGQGAFAGCSSLEPIALEKFTKLESIGDNAFNGCVKFTNIIVPNSVTYIGQGAFKNCSSLVSITIPFVGNTLGGTTNTFFGYIFGSLISNDNNQAIPTSLKHVTVTGGTVINSKDFFKCSSLESIKLSSTIKSIGANAFYSCTSLVSITIPKEVTEIGNYAFSSCTSLVSIIIPKSVTVIGNYAFKNCSLLSIYCEAKELPSEWSSSWGSDSKVYWYSESEQTTNNKYWHYGANNEIIIWHTHHYTTAVNNPTCEDKGYTTYTCDCGYSYNANFVDALGHVEVIDEGVKATCTETGLTEGKHCSACEKVLIAQEVIEALGHAVVIDKAVAPTCLETGLTEGKHCSTCQEVFIAQEVIDALGHNEVIDKAVEPTCTETGLTEGKSCSRCDKVFIPQEIIEALGHEYTFVVTPPTCEDKGYTTYTCHCFDSYVSDYVDALGHTEVVDKAVAPSCTETGLTEGKHCSTCQKVFIAQEIIEALGHTFVAKVTNPTCEDKGYTTYTCHCSDSYVTDYVDALGHTEVVDKAVEETCSKPGRTEGKHCSVCEKVLIAQEVIDAKGHNFVNNVCANCGIKQYTNGLQFTLINNDTEYEITGYTGSSKEIYIPSTYNDKPVVSIGIEAFSMKNITSVEFAPGVKVIKDSAFNGCYYLANVILPNTLTDLYSKAFAGCGLTSLELPNSLITIGSEAFVANEFTSVVVPDSVTTIGAMAFNSCYSLNDITLPFVGRSLNETTHNKFNYIFVSSGYLSSIEIDTVTITGGTIASEAFASANVKKVVLPSSLTMISDKAFYQAEQLERVVIPEGVKRIGSQAFYGCTSLKSIDIPNSVTHIGSNAFYECLAVESVTIPFIGLEKDSFSSGKFRDIFGGYGPSYIKSVKLTSGTTIPDNAFASAGIGAIELPYGLTTIGDSAFYRCSGLTDIVLPETVQSIGFEAFDGCSSLKTINIPKGVTVIEGLTFYQSGLEYLDIHEGITSISVSAFMGCSNIKALNVDENNEYYKSIDGSLYTKDGKTLIKYATGKDTTEFVIPNTVTRIEDYAISNSYALEKVVIPSSVETIGNYAFSNCSSITNIEIPSSVISIGDGAFSNCRSLKNVTIKNNDVSIGNKVFYWCDSLVGNVSDGLKYLGNSNNPYLYLFGVESKAVTTVKINDNCKYIGYRALYNCSNIENLELPNSLIKIDEEALYYCGSLKTIIIPKSLTCIGKNAINSNNIATVYYGGNEEDWANINIDNSLTSLINANRYYSYGVQNYTYKFVVNGGKEIADITSNFILMLPVAERGGYVFMGWYDNAELKGVRYTDTYYNCADATFYAKWVTEEDYNNYDGSTFEKAITIEENQGTLVNMLGSQLYFKFTASETRSYNISSNRSNYIYVYTYNSNKENIYYDRGDNFSVNYEFTEGETYYLEIRPFSSSAIFTFDLLIA